MGARWKDTVSYPPRDESRLFDWGMPIETLMYLIQSVSTRPYKWPTVLEVFNRCFEGRCAVLASYDFSVGRGRLLAQVPDTVEVRTAFETTSCSNPYLLSERIYAPRTVLIGSEIISDDELIRTDYYRYALRSNRLFRRLTAVLAHDEGRMVFVTVIRCREKPDFSAHERQALADCAPNLALAWSTQQILSDRAVGLDALKSVVEQFQPPMVVIDRDLRIVFRTTDRLDPLMAASLHASSEGGLLALNSLGTHRLRNAIAECSANAGNGADIHVTFTTDLGTGDAPTPTRLRVTFLGMASIAFGETPLELFCLSLMDAAENSGEGFHRFAESFGLTRAETRVGELITLGIKPAEVAQTLHVSINTVRSHLKDIFVKTGTHGQLDLFRQFSGSAFSKAHQKRRVVSKRLTQMGRSKSSC